MPMIGYGTWQIIFGVRKKVLKALETGYRLIDTAKIYGNEPGVGAAVRESKVPRKDIFVTTKLWNSDQGYESTLKAFDDSLKRLGLDYVDLYLIHWPGHDAQRRADSWRAMEELFNSGLIKNIGVSNFMVSHLEELMASSKIKPAVNQIEFHPYVYEDQKPIIELCRKYNIVVEAYSPLAHGRHKNEKTIMDIATKHQITSAQVMLAWAIAHETIPIPKTTNAERMEQNLGSLNVKLTVEDITQIDGLSQGEHVVGWH